MATVYVFRPYLSENASGVWPVTYFNETKVGDVKINSYTYVYVTPGRYQIRSEKSQTLTLLDNVPGQFSIPGPGDYYLAFITRGSSSVAMVGTSPMTIAGPTQHYWQMLNRADASRLGLERMRFLPAASQVIQAQ